MKINVFRIFDWRVIWLPIVGTRAYRLGTKLHCQEIRRHRNFAIRRTTEFLMGVAAVVLTTQAVAQPAVESLEPHTGPSSTLVEVHGLGLEGATIMWDADREGPVEMAMPIAGATFFSVPHDATLGSHTLHLVHASGQSVGLTFNVTDEYVDTRPRVDDVALVDAVFDGATVRATLYVQGANIDVGATVLINDIAVASQAHKALRKDLYGMKPEALGYPIRHYLSHVVPLDARPVGETIVVSVRNRGGETSPARFYKLPTEPNGLDSDGDTIPDIWETAPIDFDRDGNADLDLAPFGVDPHRKDILVELDIMDGLLNPLPKAVRRIIPRSGEIPVEQNFARTPFEVVEFVFANAPILNPFGDNGIGLKFDTSGSVPWVDTIAFTQEQRQSERYALFADLKSQHFDSAIRGRLFHYGIWGFRHANGNTGESDIDHLRNRGGDDFLIAIDRIPDLQSMRARAEVLMHEFGHNLAQWHGGADHLENKPFYWSSMSYSWLYRASKFYDDAWRKQNPTCYHAYYQRDHALEESGAAFNASLDMMLPAFSEGLGRSLANPQDTFNEHVGLCGHPIDLNEDGDMDDVVKARELKIFGKIQGCSQVYCPEGKHFTDHANWTSLQFDGPQTNGTVSPDEGGVPIVSASPSTVVNPAAAETAPSPSAAPSLPSSDSEVRERVQLTETQLAQASVIELLPPALNKRLGEKHTVNDQKKDAQAPYGQDIPGGLGVDPNSFAFQEPGAAGAAEPNVTTEGHIRTQLERLADQKWGEAHRRRVLDDIQIDAGSDENLLVTRDGVLRPGAAGAPAPEPEIEFRLEGGPIERVDRLVYSEGGDVLADTLEAGTKPVELAIEQADITARQSTGQDASPDVTVTVADETKTLRPGESALFKDGRLRIEVLTSTGPAASSVVNDGPPYALRIQASTVQP
ncbi:hypothetical protein [Mesorhizobium sp.]|uniref:hypothetical protein n=1 Tax=Mesorhizobium sp. TaxID=1871066 RepID=UPI000FE7CC77|nr:hypothetical protein [Mesorhizobium sp.]RWA97852.1 MAG: hypothetical protein EOQ33_29885 [Mesorhizobium sp.]